MPARVHVVRDLDLSAIDAVGFDLDHTLALYDDERVNGLAFEEARGFLLERGYSPSLIPPSEEYDESGVCRGLVVDTDNGCLLKADGDGRVRRASRAGRWLAQDEIARRFPEPLPGIERFHAIHSPFDLPTAFLFHRLSGRGADDERVCAEIRHDLDRAHTRGTLKDRILGAVDSLVHPLATSPSAFARLRDAGKRLFILTNSEAPYTVGVLDHLFHGPSWREVFSFVVTHAGKPGFFEGAAHGARRYDDVVFHDASAGELEVMIGVSADRVLYVGDSVKSDTLPARRFGWRTAHVVQELYEDRAEGPWGSPLTEGGRPSWFATMIAKHADIYAPRVCDLLELPPRAALLAATPAGRDGV